MARALLVRVGDLLREPGSRRDVDRAVDLGPVETSAARVIPGVAITVDGEVAAMAGGVEVIGTIGYDWAGECRRCLDDVTGHTDLALREIAQREPVDDEVYPIDDDLLDLEPMVRELVLASLPLAPLCRADCPGPDPERFPTVAEADLPDEEPEPDPRWAALADLDLEG